MDDSRTTFAVQRFLDELGGVQGDEPAEPIEAILRRRKRNLGHQNKVCHVKKVNRVIRGFLPYVSGEKEYSIEL